MNVNFSDYDIEIGNQRLESDQTDGTSLVLNAGYLDQQEKIDRRMQRALTEDSSDTGLYTYYRYFAVFGTRVERIYEFVTINRNERQNHCP